MSLEIKHRKAAHIPEPIDMNRELAEEIDDGGCARREGVPQYERRQDDREKLFDEDDDLHREQLSELFVDLEIIIIEYVSTSKFPMVCARAKKKKQLIKLCWTLANNKR